MRLFYSVIKLFKKMKCRYLHTKKKALFKQLKNKKIPCIACLIFVLHTIFYFTGMDKGNSSP